MRQYKRGERVRLTDDRMAELRRDHPRVIQGLSGRGTVEKQYAVDGYVYVDLIMDEGHARWVQHRRSVELLSPLDLIVEALEK